YRPLSTQHAVQYLELHSVPTRRSSDLTTGKSLAVRRTIRRNIDGRRNLYWHDGLPSQGMAARVLSAWPFLVMVARRANKDFSGQDRKSTRLNSSHLGISYAVFCLKKKK